jgi:uncharacterized ParB-like nuclease family protein
MKLLFENWRQYLNENKNIFYVNIHHLMPSEELGHGKDHECPSQKCDDVIQNKMHQMQQGDLEPLEVCNQAPINPHRTDGQPKAPKSGISEPVYFVLDGHHRLEAAKKLGLEKLPVYLTPLETNK